MSAPYEEALNDLKKQGLYPAARPVDQSMVIADVTDLDDVGLMEEYSLLVAWADYAYSQLAEVQTQERQLERALEYAVADYWSKSKSKSVSEAKAVVNSSQEVRAAHAGLDVVVAKRRILTEMAARYERDAAVLSREITRRTSNIRRLVTP